MKHPELFPRVPVSRRKELVTASPNHPHPPLGGADRVLLREVTKYRRGALNGEKPHNRCMMVCAGLQGYLSFFRNIETELVETWFRDGGAPFNHVYLRRLDGTIIDPTGDQFNDRGANLPPVYIGPLPEIYRRWENRPSERTPLTTSPAVYTEDDKPKATARLLAAGIVVGSVGEDGRTFTERDAESFAAVPEGEAWFGADELPFSVKNPRWRCECLVGMGVMESRVVSDEAKPPVSLHTMCAMYRTVFRKKVAFQDRPTARH